MVQLDIYPAGLRPPPTHLAAPQPRLDPGPRPSRKMKSFFWDKLPENRLQKTFWAEHPPSYASLKTDEVYTSWYIDPNHILVSHLKAHCRRSRTSLWCWAARHSHDTTVDVLSLGVCQVDDMGMAHSQHSTA